MLLLLSTGRACLYAFKKGNFNSRQGDQAGAIIAATAGCMRLSELYSDGSIWAIQGENKGVNMAVFSLTVEREIGAAAVPESPPRGGF